jgi:uncharacterized protein YlxW (UPF0749 family)
MKEDTESISSIVKYIKTLEDEIRDLRQRLESVERSVQMKEKLGNSSTQSSEHIQKINSITRELLDTIDT